MSIYERLSALRHRWWPDDLHDVFDEDDTYKELVDQDAADAALMTRDRDAA